MFDIIEPFADYAFPKAHAYGYGFIAYQTAYLKANYPVEYLAALLTSVKANLDKAAVYLNECRLMGIPVLVPDVNRSQSDFVPATPGRRAEVIPFGLSAVRNVGQALVGQLIAERESNGPFLDFYDFCDRVDPLVLNKRTHRVADQGRRRSTRSATAPGAAGRVRADRRPDRGPPARARHGGHDPVRAVTATPRPRRAAFDEPIAIPDLEFDKAQRLALREGDARPLRQRPPADGRRGGAAAAHRRARSPSLARSTTARCRVSAGWSPRCSASGPSKGDLMATFVLEDLAARSR